MITAGVLLVATLGGSQLGCSSAFQHPHPHILRPTVLRAEASTSSPLTSTKSEDPTDFDPALNPTEIDNNNTPPNLQTILTSLSELKSGSDLRGTYTAHKASGGTIANIAHLIKSLKEENGSIALTPFASHCFGAAFARWLLQTGEKRGGGNALTICIGRDPRPHGEQLADAFARGAEGVDGGSGPVRVVYTGVASTPSMPEFVRADKCDAAVMITASHLPEEKNGVKFFSKNGGLTKKNIDELIVLAQQEARHWYDMGILPPSSGNAGVLCSELVDFIPYYKETLKQALIREVGTASASHQNKQNVLSRDYLKPLSGISIVVNPGCGSGCFFDDLLRDLGANVAGSIHLTPDGTFPDTFGVPNPEKKEMVDETARACKANNADIGVMFDTE